MPTSHRKERLLPALLLVDDNRANLDALGAVLHAELPGCRVLATSSPEKAFVLAADGRVDCAVIDLNMPEISGIDLCRRLKADPRTDYFPILLTTDENTDARTRVAGIEAGADDLLERSSEPVELMAKIRVMLRIKRAENELRAVNRRLAAVAEERARDLHETDQRYRMVFNASSEAVLLFEVSEEGLAGRVLEINDTACRWLGYGHEEASRLTLRELSTPDRMHGIQGRVESILQHRQLSFETIMLGKDGRQVPVAITAGVIDTEEGRAIMALARHAGTGAVPPDDEYHFLSETGQLIYDCNIMTGKIAWGGAVTQVMGYTPAEMRSIGWRRWQRQIHSEDRGRVLARLSEALETVGKYQLEYRVLHKSGEERHIEDTGVALPGENGRAVRVIGAMKDVTARIRLEEERRRLEQEMQHSQRLESLGVLAGGIAHDFNNILAGIIGLTDLAIRDLPARSRPRGDLVEALQAAHRAKDLVKQILVFSRQSGRERAPIYLHILAREAIKLLRATLPANIEIIDSVDAHSGAAMANAAQMHQVIMNFCTNAAHAMKKRGGRLEVRINDVEVDERLAATHPKLHVGPYLRIMVSDNGHGMSPAVLARVFDPFYTTKGPGEGTGMGLAVVHGIITDHDGAVMAESRTGVGATFYAYLPRVAGMVVEEPSRMDHLAGGRERVLFVDDDEAVLRFANLALPRLGFSVTLCKNAQEALDSFDRSVNGFDIVITDQIMPGMAGTELAAELTRRRPGLPIILFTGYSDQMPTTQWREAGILSVLVKPVSVKDLVDEIRRVMDKPGKPHKARPTRLS
jgi:PAS domain S-box-containing protein